MQNKNKFEKALENAVIKVKKMTSKYIFNFPTSASINYNYDYYNNLLINDDWTSGFYTGLLWLSYEATGDKHFYKIAQHHRKIFQARLNNDIGINHHDLGFLYIPSVIAQYKITKCNLAKKCALDACEYLYKNRYSKAGGFIQAWGKPGDRDNYKMIIDALLNIPIFIWYYNQTQDQEYLDAFFKHVNNSAELLVRDDYTTFHSYLFDIDNHKPLKGITAQGFSDTSCWARGQAWAVYGFALAYKYTKDEKYLNLYINVLKKFIELQPKNKVSYWDLNFSDGSQECRDTSANAIAISGIYEMQKISSVNNENGFSEFADISLESLIDEYMTNDFDNPNAGLLKEGVYNKKTNNGVSEYNLWGDYFFMEALLKRVNKDWEGFW